MDSNHRLDRRAFLLGSASIASTLGYSVIVHAAGTGVEPVSMRDGDAIRSALDRLSPTIDTRIEADPNMRLVDIECELLVAGGGMAGVCAALAAARHGARVVLIQDRSRLGGNASSEVRMHIVGADCSGGRPGWREGGILEELRLEYMANNPHQAWEMWDMLLYDKLVSQPEVTLLLDTAVCGATVVDGRIQVAMARSDKTEHIYRIRSAFYADCTGDCRLGLEAGAAMRTGHEAFSEFEERLAPPEAGPETLGSSILFTAKDFGAPVPFTPPTWARKVTEDQLTFRGIRSWEYGYWWIEWGGRHEAIHDNERIRFELLSIVMGVWDYIKNSGAHPSSATWALNWVGMIPGKRASRRLEGPHILTQHDLNGTGQPFDDAVAIGGWPMDDHPPGGFDEPDKKPAIQIQTSSVYNIPLRSLCSRNIDNLFLAGRNISASHVAFTSTRVMGTCAVEGQAIGTVAAYCAREGKTAAELVEQKDRLRAVQQLLLRDDQTIRGLHNEDPLDLARGAKVTASHVVEGFLPEYVIDGWTRDEPEEWLHHWAGELANGEAWVQLEWYSPVTLRQVQLVLDTGFQRPLTLTEQADYRKRMILGPQPETVRDYVVQSRNPAGDWHDLLSVRSNYQRLRRHDFESVNTTALRLVVRATNGSSEARVFEIRCYA